MKTIKIFAVPSHQTKERTSGVDMARVIQPMKYLDGYEYKNYKFKVKTFTDPEEKMNWLDVAKEYDIIFFNYTASAWSFAAMGAMARKFGKKLILDTDDNLWDVQKDNPSYVVYHKGSEHIHNFSAICREVDHITTTNKYLRNVISKNARVNINKLSVIPNYIDLDLYTHRNKFKDDNQVQLLHFGSTTHFIDLANSQFEKGIDMVFKDYPNVNLVTVGAFLPKYKRMWGTRYNNAFGHTDVYKWIKEKFPTYMKDTDILVTPLENNMYTRCKSNIKWLEGSSAKLPGVWQKIRQYEETIEDGKTGLLAESAEDWYKAISKLIEDKKLRKSIGENAFNEVEKNWQIQSNVDKYAKLFVDMI